MAIDNQTVPTSHPATLRAYVEQHKDDIFIHLDLNGLLHMDAETGTQFLADIDEPEEADPAEIAAIPTTERVLHGTFRVYALATPGNHYGDFLHLCRCHQHIEEQEHYFTCEEEEA